MAGKAPSFQGMKPTPGYVAGLGRGATGFTTRCVVDGSRLLLSRCSMSPMLHVTHPGGGLTSNHVPSLRKI